MTLPSTSEVLPQADVRGQSRKRIHKLPLLTAIVLVTVNLRPAVSGISAMLEPLRSSLQLSTIEVALLTTLPTIGLALFALPGPWLYRRLSEERVILASITVITAGDVVRSVNHTAWLFAGTILITIGTGLIAGAMPGMVKRSYPDQVPLVMALYTAALTLGAAGGAALTVDAMSSFDWAPTVTLAVVTVPIAVLGTLAWATLVRRPSSRRQVTAAATHVRVYGAPMGWWVTAYFAGTGFIFYVLLSWIPAIAHGRGLNGTDSGLTLSLMSLAQIGGSLLLPVLVSRWRDQRELTVLISVVNLVGLVAFVFGPFPGGIWVGAIILGVGLGAGFGLAMTLISLRAANEKAAIQLSAMAQGIGYGVSALGPFTAGILHDATGNWVLPVFLMMIICVVLGGIGQRAGRNVTIDTTPQF